MASLTIPIDFDTGKKIREVCIYRSQGEKFWHVKEPGYALPIVIEKIKEGERKTEALKRALQASIVARPDEEWSMPDDLEIGFVAGRLTEIASHPQ